MCAVYKYQTFENEYNMYLNSQVKDEHHTGLHIVLVSARFCLLTLTLALIFLFVFTDKCVKMVSKIGYTVNTDSVLPNSSHASTELPA